MPDVAAPSSEAPPTKPSNRSEKSSKHSSRDKERSSREEHRSRSGKEGKEHKHKHKSKGKDRDREKRSNGDREQKRAKDDSRERDRHRSSRQEPAAPSGRADAEPGELAPDAPPQRGSPADRDAADGARAEAEEFLRGEEARSALPPPPQSLPPPPRPLPPPPAPQTAGPSDAELGLPPLAGDVAPGSSGALPPAHTPQTSEAGGEVSMSIEETNR